MVSVNPFSALSNLGQASTDRKAIADNFDTFLTLLTTQLKNQNPLDPLDTNQFTQQLVQFTEVEQAVKTNENLETLNQLAAATTITNAVGYIGKEVSSTGTNATLSNGAASWQFELPESSSAVTFTVYDSSGQVVSTETRAAPAGESLYVWRGEKSDGSTAADGVYTLGIKADDGTGNQLQVSMGFSGIVQGVDMSGSEPVLLVNGREVKLDQISSIKLPSES